MNVRAAARPRSGWDPRIAIVIAFALLCAGIAVVLYNERTYQELRLAEVSVQSEILAESVAAALLFDDPATAQEYLSALLRNPEIEAAGVYEETGELVAHLGRNGAAPVPRQMIPEKRTAAEGRIATSTPVIYRGTRIGTVYLRTIPEPFGREAARYSAIVLLIVMASLIVAILAWAQSQLQSINAELERRASQLADANQLLREQMEERARAEEALRQRQKLEAIGQLTGGVAHDFNNLLMVITGGLRMLERHAEGDRTSIVQAMRQAVDRGASLTRQLLAFARRETLRPEVVSIPDRVAGMRELLQRSLRENIRMELKFAADLWPVQVDPSQLELALLNLAVNARDAMPGGGTLVISGRNARSTGNDPDCVVVSVRDSGTGMSPDVLARVFEPYFTTKAVGQGTGLGLAQVYGFATQSGGTVSIDSVVGKGTVVTIRLPRSQEQLPVVETEEQTGPVPTGKEIRVLVVEDDDRVALFVGEMMQELGYRTTRVSDASAALEILDREGPPDIVFSDIIMPGGMNGLELARLIRERWPQVCVVLTTGHAGRAVNPEGEFPTLRKPYQLEELRAVLAKALAGMD